MSELYIQNTAERVAAWSCLRALLAQIESLGVVNPASRMRLPDDVRVWPLAAGETRGAYDEGDVWIQSIDGSRMPVFPVGFRVEEHMFIVANIIDRGSVGSGATHFGAGGARLTMATFPGESHDAWNAIRTAAKKRGGGRVWKAVVRMASIQNLPYGPYRSGAWGRQMQSAHHQSMDEVTADSEEFHEAMDLHVLIDPLRYGGADKDQYFKYFGRLPCCVRAPEVLKFARWHSVESCWKELRKDIGFIKIVLRRMKKSDGEADDKECTHLWNHEVSADPGKGGLLARVPSYITLSLCDTIDIFCMASHAVKKQVSQRLVEVKTTDAAMQLMLEYAVDGREQVILDTIKALYDKAAVQRLCGNDVAPGRAAANVNMLWDQCTGVASELLIRYWSTCAQFPGVSICVLHQSDETCIGWCKIFADEFDTVLRWEAAIANGSMSHAKVLSLLTWRLEPLARVFFNLCDRCARNPSFLHIEEVRNFALAIHDHFFDEKAPEDMHQHIRDVSRNLRSKRARMMAIHESVIRSGVLEGRKVDHPFTPADQDVVRFSWMAARDRLKSEPPLGVPKDSPKFLNKILQPVRDWASPTVRTLYNSTMAAFWMHHHDSTDELRKENPDAAHWSRLVVPGTLLEDCPSNELLFVLDTADFGSSCQRVTVAPCDRHITLCTEHSSLRCAHVLNPLDYNVWKLEPEYMQEVGIVCARTVCGNVLQYALKSVQRLPAWQQYAALTLLQVESSELPAKCETHLDLRGAALLKLLCKIAFRDDPTLGDSIFCEYYKPQPDGDDSDWDEEYRELLEEMAVQDASNSAELEGLKKDAIKKRNRKLVARKARTQAQLKKDREAKQARRTMNVAKAKEKQKQKGRSARLKAQIANGGRRWKRPAQGASSDLPQALLAPQPAPVASSDSVPQAHEGVAPKATGGWRVMETAHGWLRWNSAAGKCDAHCRYHDKCKMDRSVRNATVGLSMAWLENGAQPGGKYLHQVAKEIISSEDSFDQRVEARRQFEALAATNEAAQAVLDMEAAVLEQSRPVVEPPVIPCRSLVAGPSIF